MFHRFLLVIALFIGVCLPVKGETQPAPAADPWMNYAQKAYVETSAPLPHYVLGRILTDTKQPTQYQSGQMQQRSPLSGLGALACLVGLIAALADPAHASEWWTVCFVGFLVYLFF